MFQQLCSIRGYDIVDEKDQIAFDPIIRERIKYILVEDEKLDMNFFYKWYSQIDKTITHVIFVYSVATIQTKKLKMYKDILSIEFFSIDELRRLLIGNRFIPKHTRICQKEQDFIIKRFDKENLPCILNTDPMVRLYNFQVDSIIKIERPDNIYYRRVIEEF